MKKETETLIEVREAVKRYSKNAIILRGLNMTVEKGTVYGLLGASGCGKTTLLMCVSGQGKLDSGTINVNLESRSQLGYMPQDIALIELFTVSEILKYFGKVHGMSESEIIERGSELLNLMELPPDRVLKRMISNLSGGQQRRVSLCVALLHNPLLLILDEPTVGLDPLINEKLWEYFVHITRHEEKTIIITTHYIEETKKANRIGLMRNGVLLAEDSPSQLLKKHQCTHLEDVFLLLSEKQAQVSSETLNGESGYKRKKSDRPMKIRECWNCNRMNAQIYKNFCWIKRNIPVMLFMLVLPALLTTLFCIVFQDKFVGVDVAFVSDEVLPDSCLNQNDPNLVIPPCSNQSRYSCRYVNMVGNRNYGMREYETFDLAHGAFLKGKVRALMVFNKNYSTSLVQRLSDGFRTPAQQVDDSNVEVYIDRAEVTMTLIIEKTIRDVLNELMVTIMIDCGNNPRLGKSILQFNTPVFGENPPRFTHSSMAGFIIPAVFYFTTFLSASSLGSEKISGFLDRCLVSGVTFMEIVAAHGIVQVFMLLAQTAMILVIAYGIFQLPMIGEWTLAVLFMIIVQLQGMFYGFILGTLFDKETNVIYVALGTVLCLFLACGMFWPTEGAHWLVRHTVKYFPIIMAVKSYHSITMRGWSFTHKYIMCALAANIGCVLVLLVVFIVVCKVKM